jgi:hypothetical protein
LTLHLLYRQWIVFASRFSKDYWIVPRDPLLAQQKFK